jgi:hypothetical protein
MGEDGRDSRGIQREDGLWAGKREAERRPRAMEEGNWAWSGEKCEEKTVERAAELESLKQSGQSRTELGQQTVTKQNQEFLKSGCPHLTSALHY